MKLITLFMPDFKEEEKLWKRGFLVVAGADEVGRGAWSGPVVAGVVVFGPESTKSQITNDKQIQINDSKKLNPKQRERANEWIRSNCLAWGIGECPASYINKHGIVCATRKAFRRALKACNTQLALPGPSALQGVALRACDFLLVDAFYLPYTKGLKRKNQKAIVRGDSKSISIAAASIIAKVYRDKLMSELAKKHRKYGWERNAGYGTKEHQEAIRKHGITRYHRKQFVHEIAASLRSSQ